jgi:excisionase family DNA binding protein
MSGTFRAWFRADRAAFADMAGGFGFQVPPSWVRVVSGRPPLRAYSECARIPLAVSRVPHRQPRSIRGPGGRPRLNLKFPRRRSTSPEAAGLFAHVVKCARILRPVPAVKRLFTLAEAAEYIGRSPKAIEHLIQRGTIPVTKIDGKRQVDKAALDKIISDHTYFES